MTDMIAAASAIREAVSILTKGGAYRRALDIHHRGSGSRCASCGQYSPCSMETWATTARDQVARTTEREARAVDRAVRAGIAVDTTTDPQADRSDRLSADTGGAA